METKKIEYLIRFSEETEKEFPDKTAYWHLQRLRAEMERIKKYDLLQIVSNCPRELVFLEWWNELKDTDKYLHCLKNKIKYPDLGEIKHCHLNKDK